MQSVPQNKLNRNQEQRYITSNDGVGVSEFRSAPPRQLIPGSNPNVPMNNGPEYKTPTLIQPLKYIVYNNPQAVYNFLTNMGYNVKNDIPSTYQFAKNYIRERGEEGVLDIVRAAHPDKDLILQAFNASKGPEIKESGFAGEQPPKKEETPGAKMAAPTTTEEKTQGIKITANTVIIILIVIIFFILITKK